MDDSTAPPRTYPAGVPCWVDTAQPDPVAAAEFYGGLFGWSFENALPADASAVYLIATLEGRDVAAVASGAGPASWATFIAVDDADATADAVRAAGGTVRTEPQDAGPGGRTASCADPGGARFELWQPRARPGAQYVNGPGGWNFSHLHTSDAGAARAFYTAVFGWEYDDVADLGQASVRKPGYGAHLAATSDPGIYERQSFAPRDFADVVAGVQPRTEGEDEHWHVVFSVADRDDAAGTAERLGGTVLATYETGWAALAEVRDPQGARLALSEFRPPS